MEITTGQDVRERCRRGIHTTQTSGLANGYAQANLCILPKEYAFDFLLFCQRNPKPCPLLEVLEPGQAIFGNDIDIRSDLPKYRLYVDGFLERELNNINELWQDDLVTFVIGCSFSFEEAMIRAGLGVRHVEQCSNVPMYAFNEMK